MYNCCSRFCCGRKTLHYSVCTISYSSEHHHRKRMGYQSRINSEMIWTASSEFGTYSLCEQRRFRRACASAQSRQNLRCSLIQAVNQEEPSDRKPDPWPLWMAGHAQLKFVMTECSKTQIRLAGLILRWRTSPESLEQKKSTRQHKASNNWNSTRSWQINGLLDTGTVKQQWTQIKCKG